MQYFFLENFPHILHTTMSRYIRTKWELNDSYFFPQKEFIIQQKRKFIPVIS